MIVSIKNDPAPPPPPRRVTVEMTEQEALILTKILGRCSQDDLRRIGVDIATPVLPAIGLEAAGKFATTLFNALRLAGVR